MYSKLLSLSRRFSYKHVAIRFHQDARLALFKGIERLNEAVMQTLGPKGSNVAMDYEIGPPKITKDGVTVAKHIEFSEPWDDLGCKIMKFPANESNNFAGDGTTTSTIIATAILKEGLRYLDKGHHPILIREGLLRAAKAVDEHLKNSSIPITREEELLAICTVACNNDHRMANMILDGILRAGRDGAFLVEEGNSFEDRLTVTCNQVSDGFVVPRGYASEMFGASEFELKLETPLVLVASHRFHELAPILHVLEYAKKQGRSLIIAGEDIDKEVLSTLLYNKEKAELSCCAINFPGENNYMFLEDLAAFTGATLLNPHTITELQINHLGSCKKANVDNMKSVFIHGNGDASVRRSQILSELLAESDAMAQSVLKERLQRLSGKMAVIEIGLLGGKLAMGERRDRIVDSLNSVKSAAKEGFLPGGGVSLLYASRVLSKLRLNNESDVGVRILQEALKIPFTIIAKTSAVGISAVDSLWTEPDEEMGVDADKGEVCNLVERGIIDSAPVVRQAVRAAVSVSQMILSTSAAVARTVRYQPTKLNKYKKDIF